jgi:hypothetical protein
VTPTSFQSARVLKALNVVAVGFALAAITGAIFGAIMHVPGLIVGPSTLGVGLAWALVLRARKTIGKSPVRWGWLASVPLAILNAAIACGMLAAWDGAASPFGKTFIQSFATGALLGATFGALYWLPALLLTLLCFGAPIAWSQMLARKGLAGEERGERIVGFVSFALSVAAIVLSFVPDPYTLSSPDFARGFAFVRIAAIVGVLSGGASALLAHLRERRRRAFVTRAAAGEVRGFRVDDAAEGKVLVRVTSQGQGYRVADFHEEVFLLDDEGLATEARASRR